MEAALTEGEVVALVSGDFVGDDCEVLEHAVETASDEPTGFLGDHARLRVRLRRGQDVLERSYFVKAMPATKRAYLQELRCFQKEIALYETVFRRLRVAAPGVPDWHPRCLFARGEEVIVLEDLAPDGYYLYPERGLMDEEHVLSSLRALAYMHASSVVFEEKLRREASREGTTIPEVFRGCFSEAPDPAAWVFPLNGVQETAIAAQLKVVDLLTGYSLQEKETIKRELPGRMRRLAHLVKPSQKFRNVIIHGDLWSNNLLFRKDAAGRVASAKIVDFQLARYAPPAQDIVTFLHLVQKKSFREEKQAKLLRHYYEVFSDCLARHGIRPAEVVTWYELLGTCDYYEELGLVTALFFFQLILAPPNVCRRLCSSPETFLFDRSGVVVECFAGDRFYRERVSEAMNELIKEYIL